MYINYGPTTVTSADLDLTLIVCLLRNIPPLVTEPPTGFDNLPPPHDKSDGANIARLKYYKNFLVSHSKDGTLPNADFVRIWSELEQMTYSEYGTTNVKIDTDRVIETVSDRFLSVTIDTSTIQANWATLNLSSPKVQILAKALSPCYLRVGGSSGRLSSV
ncbi:HPSE [Mytilus edulis]|uniref:HPSE n=1 Tax=Mytilus edulis TaxID=6550 RepID=A0A8S3UMD6_MYTED|nr:HPSE [Mytilus edulis]